MREPRADGDNSVVWHRLPVHCVSLVKMNDLGGMERQKE